MQKDVKARPQKPSDDDEKGALTYTRRMEKPTGPARGAEKVGGA